MKIASIGDEIHIRSIEISRKQAPAFQADIERSLGGLDLTQYERPFQHLDSIELWRASEAIRAWRDAV